MVCLIIHFLQLTFTSRSFPCILNSVIRGRFISTISPYNIIQNPCRVQWYCWCHHHHHWTSMESNWCQDIVAAAAVVVTFVMACNSYSVIDWSFLILSLPLSPYERWRCGYFEGFDWKPLVAFATATVCILVKAKIMTDSEERRAKRLTERITCARDRKRWQCVEHSESDKWMSAQCLCVHCAYYIVCIYNFVCKSSFRNYGTSTLVHWFMLTHTNRAREGERDRYWGKISSCAFIIIHILRLKSRTLPNPPQCENIQTCKRYTWCTNTATVTAIRPKKRS